MEMKAKEQTTGNTETWTHRPVTEAMASLPDSRGCGDASAMRKALEDALELLESDDRQMIAYSDTGALMDIIRPALARPPRNCDVGTAEEQWTRFERQCEAHRLPTDHDYCSCSCKVDGGCVNECAIIWSQMPYAPAEGGVQ